MSAAPLAIWLAPSAHAMTPSPTPSAAVPVATESPAQLRAGQPLSFRLRGFPAGAIVDLTLDEGRTCSPRSVHGNCIVHKQRIRDDGTASGSFVLPADVKAGPHRVTYTAAPTTYTGAVFTLLAAQPSPAATPAATRAPAAPAPRPPARAVPPPVRPTAVPSTATPSPTPSEVVVPDPIAPPPLTAPAAPPQPPVPAPQIAPPEDDTPVVPLLVDAEQPLQAQPAVLPDESARDTAAVGLTTAVLGAAGLGALIGRSRPR